MCVCVCVSLYGTFTYNGIYIYIYIYIYTFLYSYFYMIMCVIHSVMSDFLKPHGLWPARLPCPWISPGKNTGVGCHLLLQGIFLAQGSNPGNLYCRQILYHLSHQGSPVESNLMIRPEKLFTLRNTSLRMVSFYKY